MPKSNRPKIIKGTMLVIIIIIIIAGNAGEYFENNTRVGDHDM